MSVGELPDNIGEGEDPAEVQSQQVMIELATLLKDRNVKVSAFLLERISNIDRDPDAFQHMQITNQLCILCHQNSIKIPEAIQVKSRRALKALFDKNRLDVLDES
jgi:hypothetical protein